MDSTNENHAARESPAADRSPAPAEPPTTTAPRASGRLASRLASAAIKRSMEDREESGDEEAGPTKRARLNAGSTAQEEEYAPDNAQAEGSHDDSWEATMESTAGATSEQSPARKTKVTKVAKVANATINGPPAWGKPLVWAKARGSLCEALPYFRSFKSSLHSANVVCKGFLIDQEVDQLDVFGPQIIIPSV